MPLQEYNRKRDFKKTREPKGKSHRQAKDHPLMFVVQEHHASHLHYDFRLEWDGVLKSWAVPKGPSLDPSVKRLAVEVEDHPISYGSFEGIIPEKQYGAGEVFIWDTGTWQPTFDAEAGFKKGHLSFELKGKKLKGHWDLIKTKIPGRQSQWLLIKTDDRYSSTKPLVPTKAEAPSRNSSAVTKSTRSKKATTSPGPSKKKSAKKASRKSNRSEEEDNVDEYGEKIHANRFSNRLAKTKFMAPELALLVDTPPSGDDWIHEMKFDGYRIQAHIHNHDVRLITRSGKDWTSAFPMIATALSKLTVDQAVLDGEIVVLDEKGRSDFQLLQNALKDSSVKNMIYYAFDLLSYSGQDIRELPLVERKKRLKMILAKAPTSLRYSDEIEGTPKQLMKIADKFQLEGIVSKNRNSPYVSGRNSAWMKSKRTQQQEFVIGGYIEGSGARAQLGALLLGVYKEDKLTFVGKVGTGFTEKSLSDVLQKLQHIEQKITPFDEKIPKGKGIHWVQPRLSAEIVFAEWTQDGHLRVPVFHGLREDKPAKQIVREKSVKSSIHITNPDKIIYQKEKITKMDIAQYYLNVADEVLPYLQNRPLNLLRCPEGPGKGCFFQKHLPKPLPPALEGVSIKEKSATKTYMTLHDSAGLQTLVQMGAFEIHCWNSQADNLEYPDQFIMDLDPGPDVSWKQVVAAAFELKEILDHLKLKSFVKVTGGKGVHIHVPVKPLYTWDQIKNFCQALAIEMENRNPDLYVSKMTKSLRTKRIFIYYLRNGRGATAVTPYSLRARDISAVAMPVEWTQLKRLKSPSEFTLPKALTYLKKRTKDPWQDYLRTKQRIAVLDQSTKSRSRSVDDKELHLS